MYREFHVSFSLTCYSPQAQSIVFYMSQSLEEVLARESVKWTAIALVNQDSVFYWHYHWHYHWYYHRVAYAMTRGPYIFSLRFEV